MKSIHHHRPDDADICWNCGKSNDCVSPADESEDPPKSGDYGLCFNCGEVMVYTGLGIRSRQPTSEERQAALDHDEVGRVRGLILAYRATEMP